MNSVPKGGSQGFQVRVAFIMQHSSVKSQLEIVSHFGAPEQGVPFVPVIKTSFTEGSSKSS